MTTSILFFATNRNPLSSNGEITDYGDRFNPVHPHELRFGYVEVDLGDNWAGRTIEGLIASLDKKPLKLRTYKENLSKSKKDLVLGSRTMFDNLAQSMTDDTPTLVFVHGYANSFKSAVVAATVFQEKLRQDDFKINVVLFSWPSDGSHLYKAYFSDRRDASASGMAFVRGFLKLKDFLSKIPKKKACEQSIHLLCHSMGNFVLEKTLREMPLDCPGRLPHLFDEIILAAADVDHDGFEYDHKLARLPEICRRVTVYFNRNDKALTLSDTTKGNPDRLGQKGPRKPLDVPSGVVLTDCSEVAISGLTESGHSYFLEDRIRNDIIETLGGVREDNIKGREYMASSNAYMLK